MSGRQTGEGEQGGGVVCLLRQAKLMAQLCLLSPMA